ncbi:hypothetical protein E2C01_050440 [Portunus trituberculatus]|uniref:Uncharacterized protein n=1 Tax=Portunus trituberculatus TaxID=210409 RepID=A0A5B7G902_PORTR|nr:hypothetical protein [Portunus trituberculatus]
MKKVSVPLQRPGLVTGSQGYKLEPSRKRVELVAELCGNRSIGLVTSLLHPLPPLPHTPVPSLTLPQLSHPETSSFRVNRDHLYAADVNVVVVSEEGEAVAKEGNR